MRTAVKRWGNSLGVRIPKSILEENSLKEGSEINIISKDGTIIFEPVKKKYNLKDLLEGINESNLHREISTGDSVGEEIW